MAFSPERIDPGNGRWDQRGRAACRRRSHRPVRARGGRGRRRRRRPACTSSPRCEAAEMTKLYENTFRAVNIAWANEMAGASRALRARPDRDHPGRGHQAVRHPAVLAGRRRRRALHPVRPALPAARAARAARRCAAHAARDEGDRDRGRTCVAERVVELLEDAGVDPAEGRVLVVGASYKPGVRDTRESPAVRIMRSLGGARASRSPTTTRWCARSRRVTGWRSSRCRTRGPATTTSRCWSRCTTATTTAGSDEFEHVLDCTYRTPLGAQRSLI